MKSAKPSIKMEQRTVRYFRELSSLIQNLSIDVPKVSNVYVTRVKLTRDCKICYVYFAAYTGDDQEEFTKALEILKLYKPSLRTAVARNIGGKYTPDLIFVFDETKEKERKMSTLLSQIHNEIEEIDKNSETESDSESE